MMVSSAYFSLVTSNLWKQAKKIDLLGEKKMKSAVTTKKVIRYLSFVLALVLVLGVSLTGCSSNKGTSSTVSASTNLPTIGETLKYNENTVVNGGKPITLNFWLWRGALDTLFRTWSKEYTTIHPNVKFTYTTYAYADLFQKLPIALQSGTGPDIFMMHNQFTNVLVPNMAPYPNNVLPVSSLDKDFRQVDQHVINGKLYYMDMGIMTAGMFYNTDMWTAAGLTNNDIPKTWDQFTAVAKKLTKTDSSGNITVAGFNMNTYMQYLWGAMNDEKGQFMFDNAGTKAIINTAISTQNAQYLHDLYWVDKVGSTKFPANDVAFGTGKAAIIYCWGWVGSELQTKYTSIKYGFFPIPTFDGNTPKAYDRNNGESSPGVSAKADAAHQAVAFDFIKYYLANDTAMQQFDTLDYMAPSKFALDNNPKIVGDPALEGQAKLLTRTYWPGPVPDPYFTDITKYIGDDIMINNIPVAQAIAKAQSVVDTDLPSTGFKSTENSYQYASEMLPN
jgi:multiple sugar transport system substrate-binding protein